MSTVVTLNVYDVTVSTSETTNAAILRINSFTRDLNFGGVFHGAVEINGYEWSFGYCERGSGVYHCPSKKNPMYAYRESVELGDTEKTTQQIKEILSSLKLTWPGTSYDLLSRNCCHFCEVLCAELGVKAPPAWLNRFATGADATVAAVNNTITTMRGISQEFSRQTTLGMVWLRESWQRSVYGPSDAAARSASSPPFARPSSVYRTLPPKLWSFTSESPDDTMFASRAPLGITAEIASEAEAPEVTKDMDRQPGEAVTN